MYNPNQILFCADDAALLAGLTRFMPPLWTKVTRRLCGPPSHTETLLFSDYAPGVWRLTLRFNVGLTSRRRVAVCGERAGRLWAEGKTDAAIVLDQLFNELAKHHEMDILCIYPLPDAEDDKADFSSLCAEHCSFSFLWSRP